MGSQKTSLATTYLLGLLIASCLGPGSSWDGSDVQVRLTGSSSRCQGQLEVSTARDTWNPVCSRSWGWSPGPQEDAFRHMRKVCQQLHCGEVLAFCFYPPLSRSVEQVTCRGSVGSFSNCTHFPGQSQCLSLGLICQEFSQTAPPPTTPPTSPPPTTTPEPTAPPRLQLVAGPGALQCAGMVEFYSGSLGGTILYEDTEQVDSLGSLLCSALQCGTFLRHLPLPEVARAPGLPEPRRESKMAGTGTTEGRSPLPRRWKVQNSSCASLPECFRKIQPQEDGQALALVCSGFQPKVQSRLVGGSGVCEGSVEVRHGAQWLPLCDSYVAKRQARWEELCQEQQCGRAISFHTLDTSGTTTGLSCADEKLSQCYKLQERKSNCKRVFVTCQDPNPAGLAAGTVASIILTLVLLAVLLVMCGPIAYKKLLKKFRQKKQRQWIGPTGMSQSISFHRNHTMRSQVENSAASHVDNEYSQPPRNSHLSAYPALEGALQRASAQPDNSSDSDYDLHTAQRL